MNAGVDAPLVNRARWRPAPVPCWSSRCSSLVIVSVPPCSVSAGVDMIEEAGAEDRRIDGLPGERVDACPGESLPRRGGQRRGADAGADVSDPDLHGRVARESRARK